MIRKKLTSIVCSIFVLLCWVDTSALGGTAISVSSRSPSRSSREFRGSSSRSIHDRSAQSRSRPSHQRDISRRGTSSFNVGVGSTTGFRHSSSARIGVQHKQAGIGIHYRHYPSTRHYRNYSHYRHSYPYNRYSYKNYRPSYYSRYHYPSVKYRFFYSYPYSRYYYYPGLYSGYSSGGNVNYEYNYNYFNTPADLREDQYAAKLPDTSNWLDEVVDAIRTENYALAVRKSEDAVFVYPNSIEARFAYAQSLFAWQDYDKSARILREAITLADKSGKPVLFATGFYEDESQLRSQILKLRQQQLVERFDDDLTFLLGYQLMSVGEWEQAKPLLRKTAVTDPYKDSASLLLNVIEEIQQETQNNPEKGETEKQYEPEK